MLTFWDSWLLKLTPNTKFSDSQRKFPILSNQIRNSHKIQNFISFPSP